MKLHETNEVSMRRLPGEVRRTVWRVALYVIGGSVGVLITLAVGATVASASTHSQNANPTTFTSGYTLCAASSGAVTFSTASTCPAGSTKLTVGEQSDVSQIESQVQTLTSQVTQLKSQVATLNAQHTADASAIAGLQQTLSGVSRPVVNGKPTLQISVENVQIVNRTG